MQPEASDAAPTVGVRPKGHIGLIVVLSMLSGLILALVMTIFVFGGAEEPTITGVALLSFAFGWAMLAWLSIRRTDQPQRWAYVPAIIMGILGLVHLVLQPSDRVLRAFGWVWPVLVLALAIWMIVRAHRSLHSWSRWLVVYPMIGLLFMAAAGGAYAAIGEARDDSTVAMPGQLVDVGGRDLHISCAGSGSPTVILEAGLGESGAVMARWIQPGVSTTTRLCVYDRAGRGWSDPADTPRDGVAIATDLHTLLENADVPGPYVLAGHSSGGVFIQVFAERYPDEVAGMVLLDAQPPDAIDDLPGYAGEYEALRRGLALVPSFARLGVMRLAYASQPPDVPSEGWAQERASMSTAGDARATRDEIAGLKDALQQAQAFTGLGAKPLIVATAAEDAHAGWMPLQDELTDLSTNSVQRVVPDASHSSLIEDEHDAANAIAAIRDVVTAVRSGEPLI
jgi:pimeloyl-ACP methyl ester carboxylesterase